MHIYVYMRTYVHAYICAYMCVCMYVCGPFKAPLVTTPRRKYAEGRTCLCVFCVGLLCGHSLRWWVLCGVPPTVWVPCGWGPPLSCSRFPWHLFLVLPLVFSRSRSRSELTLTRCPVLGDAYICICMHIDVCVCGPFRVPLVITPRWKYAEGRTDSRPLFRARRRRSCLQVG